MLNLPALIAMLTDDLPLVEDAPVEDRPVDPVLAMGDTDEQFESLIASYHTR
jgi:hypothetical protein